MKNKELEQYTETCQDELKKVIQLIAKNAHNQDFYNKAIMAVVKQSINNLSTIASLTDEETFQKILEVLPSLIIESTKAVIEEKVSSDKIN